MKKRKGVKARVKAVGSRNTHDDLFWKHLIEQSESKTESAITEWESYELRHCSDSRFVSPPACICGKKGIEWVYILKNTRNGNLIQVGSDCVKRWDIPVPGWRGGANYLQSALLMARDEREKTFVKGLLHKAVAYEGRVIISVRQKRWLEDITGHPWRGKTWPERKVMNTGVSTRKG